MAIAKSPFLVFQNFLSPKVCEQIVYDLNLFSPDEDPKGNPLKMTRSHEPSEQAIFERFQPIIPLLEKHYDFKHKGTEYVTFEYYAEGVKSECQCENSNWTKKSKWVRTKDRDFTCLLFLSTYQDQTPFDNEFEVYGGKVEFPQHKFGFNPERGTLIVFPSGPHFINAVSQIIYGDLYLARFHVAASTPYVYQPANFPGTYLSWFKDVK